ncbi:MAG: tRNA pseudouridine(55) synthase TruB [bacterium]
MIIIINKPKGITSHDVVDVVRKKIGTKKVGHTGTLDPMAKGVLIVLTDEDTKRQREFVGLEKEYVAEIILGIKTDTFDIEGKILESTNSKIPNLKHTKNRIKEILQQFLGETIQIVPVYSAVKIKGKPLYKYVREGKTKDLVLPKRKINIRKIELFDKYEKDGYPVIKIRVVCSKGTYIRSLANDIGNKLGCGGTLLSLLRTRVGSYTLEESVKLEDSVIR